MTRYRVDFETHSGRVYHSAELMAHDDEDARRQARNLKAGVGKGYRIWHGDRHVHSEVY